SFSLISQPPSTHPTLSLHDALPIYYSIAGRDLEREIVPLMNEEKLGLMVWSPLAGGLLSGKYGPGAPGSGEGRRASFDFPPVDKDRKSTRLNSSHLGISYAVFCLKK